MAHEHEQDHRPDGTDQPAGQVPDHPAAPPPPPVDYGGGLGSMPAPMEADRQPPPPPTPVVISFWIWILGAVLSVVGGVVTVLNRNTFLDQLRKNPPQGVRPDQYQQLVTLTITVSVVIALAFAGLYVLFAYKIRAGRNWARTTLTVLTVLGVIYDLYAGATASTYISALVSVVAVALLYMPASRDFFAATRTPRP